MPHASMCYLLWKPHPTWPHHFLSHDWAFWSWLRNILSARVLCHQNFPITIQNKISVCCHPNSDEPIPMNFYTWLDSCAVVTWATIYSDVFSRNKIMMKLSFHRIWIVLEKALVKWIPYTLWSLWLPLQFDINRIPSVWHVLDQYSF